MRTYTDLSFDSGNECARLISLEHVVITRSAYLKCGVVWKMSDWADLAEASGDNIIIADTFHPHPLDSPTNLSEYSNVYQHRQPAIYPPLPRSPEPEPEPEAESEPVTYRLGTSLYWTVNKDNYSIAVVRKAGVFQVKRCDNSVVVRKAIFFPSVAAWTQTLQQEGTLVVSPPKKKKIICIAPRHRQYC